MQFQEVEYIDKSQGISLNEFDNIKGIFGGYVAYYENKDRQGDIIKKGAFAEDIEKFYNKEKTISVFHEHNPYIVLSAEPIEIKETNKGLSRIKFTHRFPFLTSCELLRCIHDR